MGTWLHESIWYVCAYVLLQVFFAKSWFPKIDKICKFFLEKGLVPRNLMLGEENFVARELFSRKKYPPAERPPNCCDKGMFCGKSQISMVFVFGYTICHTMSGLAGLGLLMQRLFCECCLCAGLPGWPVSGLPGPNQHGWAAWACWVHILTHWHTYPHTYIFTYFHIYIFTIHSHIINTILYWQGHRENNEKAWKSTRSASP